MSILLQTLGAALVVTALADIYLTVLFARSGRGLLTPQLYRTSWAGLRTAARLGRGRGRSLLEHSGPLLIVLTLLTWGVLLLTGFGLVVWPELGSGVQASGNRPTPQDIWTALYFAGYSLSTLGTGDLVPKTGFFRLLMVLQAAIGFSVLTLTLTYVMSVYTALAQRNRFALTLHHLTGDGGDAAELLARLGLSDEAGGSETRRVLASIAVGLDDLYESHNFYPILHYFFFRETHYAMARVLYTALDAASLLRAGYGNRGVATSAEAEAVWRSGKHLLERLSKTFLSKEIRERERNTGDDEQRWRKRYRSSAEALHPGSETPNAAPDASAENRYISLRREWDGGARAFCRYMAYDWDEVAGADLRSPSSNIPSHEHATS